MNQSLTAVGGMLPKASVRPTEKMAEQSRMMCSHLMECLSSHDNQEVLLETARVLGRIHCSFSFLI